MHGISVFLLARAYHAPCQLADRAFGAQRFSGGRTGRAPLPPPPRERLENSSLPPTPPPKGIPEPLWSETAQSSVFCTTVLEGFGEPSEFNFEVSPEQDPQGYPNLRKLGGF